MTSIDLSIVCAALVHKKVSVVCDFGGGKGGTNWAVVAVSDAVPTGSSLQP